MSDKIKIEKKVLSENDRIAAEIRTKLNWHHIPSFNMVSSPGSGKTSLLEKTLAHFKDKYNIAVVAGDVQTENDANRLLKAGGQIIRPIVTNGMCHLDASMVEKSMAEFELDKIDLFVIENVGNLVCPSSYDLGEDLKVVLISTTEGDDKPLKYPGMFRRSSVMVINKTDLVEYCDFSIPQVIKNAHQINGQLEVFQTSCRSGAGLENWYNWLEKLIQSKKAQ